MRVTNAKNCFCHTCDRAFHYLCIARHRAMHRDNRENCEITFTYGSRRKYWYASTVEAVRKREVSECTFVDVVVEA